MCGICGVFNLDGSPAGPADLEAVRAMRSRLVHRGPDDEGEWSGGPVALGFRRLSILDIAGGHQPMASEDGETVVVFNGEIYNHPRLKADLEAAGGRYRTRSDTETVLRMWGRHGPRAFSLLEGMFAVGLWDGRRRELALARDAMGVKPLYYSILGSKLLFSSELRALLAAGVPDRADPAGVVEYLCYGRVHSPGTILASVLKLPPGHLLLVDSKGLRIEKYWELPPPGPARPVRLEEAAERVEALLKESVRGQLLSDVPVGAFLSGGVDSSLITALMARERAKPVPTFSIGFSGSRAGLDESEHARRVSRHLGTDHHELVLPMGVLDRVEELVPSLDEPLGDSAILPTYLLARHAKETVKVALSGEGADELFAGYNRYKAALLSEQVQRLPAWARRWAAMAARGMGRGKVFDEIPMGSVREWAEAFAHNSLEELGGILDPDFVESARRPEPMAWARLDEEPHSLNASLAFDMRTVLCDSLLMKVDKATMRASLEARVPYLDRRLVEYALSLPASTKIRRFKGKFVLRRVAEKYLPPEIAWRKKHGFVVPWEEWVRAPGRGRLDEAIADPAVESRGIFSTERLQEARRRLQEGDRRVDSGLFFRAVVLALWFCSLKEYAPSGRIS